MNKLLGILLVVVLTYLAMLASHPRAASAENHANLARRIGTEGVLALGAAVVIITGGIDLSIGSVVGLSAIVFGLLVQADWNPLLAAALVLAGVPLLGLLHGLLITKLALQPFLVTLCGLFIYRGLARWATWREGTSRDVGLGGKHLDGLEFLMPGQEHYFFGIPPVLFLMLGLALLLALLLHGTIYGRYLYALGANEQAARYAGIPTDRYKILAYMICAFTAGLGGILEMLEVQSASPAVVGSWYELFAITAAVLGGCSLRGGEGTIPGVVLGAAFLPLLNQLCEFRDIPDDLRPTVVGIALLLGTIADEVLRRTRQQRPG
jgi:ribose transport system permease protein